MANTGPWAINQHKINQLGMNRDTDRYCPSLQAASDSYCPLIKDQLKLKFVIAYTVAPIYRVLLELS